MRAILIFVGLSLLCLGGLIAGQKIAQYFSTPVRSTRATKTAPLAKAAPITKATPRTKMVPVFIRPQLPPRSQPILDYVEVAAVQEEGEQEKKEAPAVTPTTSSGSPWWWLLAIGAVVGAACWWRRRRKPAPRATVIV